MTWLALLRLLLSLAHTVMNVVQQRQLLAAGEANAIAKQIISTQATVDKAIKARDAALKRFDDTGGVPDDNDPNLRD